VIAAIAVGSALLPATWSSYGLEFGAVLLVGAFLWSAVKVYQVAIRFTYFVDRIRLRDVSVIRKFRQRRMLREPGPTYQHNTNPVPKDLKEDILETPIPAGRLGHPR
jgi:hypothetical protein